jgi:hypothetical protein
VDGEIAEVRVPPSAEEGEEVQVEVCVRNTGNVGEGFEVRLSHSSGTVSGRVELQEGETGRVTLSFPATRRDGEIGIALYAGGALLDSRRLTLQVLYTDGEISGLSLPPSVEEFQPIEATVRVRNTGTREATFLLTGTYGSESHSEEIRLPAGGEGPVVLRFTALRGVEGFTFSLVWENGLLDEERGSVEVLYPVLSLTQRVTRYEWGRGPDDLPSCTVSGSFTLTNSGTGAARKVGLTLDAGAPRSLGTIPYLGPGQSYTGSWSETLGEGSHTVVLRAGSASSSVSVDVRFPRYLKSQEMARLYITPRDPVIASLASEILRKKSWWTPDWMAIRDWVASQIRYRYDRDSHGVEEYWQLPRETVELGTGDCEDFAILCCSLLRAAGYGPDEVYVVANYAAGHAYLLWVEELPPLGKMYLAMEPQAGGWRALFEDYILSFQDLMDRLKAESGSGRWLAFNDVFVLTP